MKRTGHKNFNAVSHNRARPEVLFSNLTWWSRGQISSVLLPLLLFAFSNVQEMWGTRGMIFYVLAVEIRKESQSVGCVGSLVLMLKISSDRSCC